MILKIGMYGKEEIVGWRYFQNVSNLMISSFISNEYYFEKSTGKLFYEPMTPVVVDTGEGEEEYLTRIDMTECLDRMFDKPWCTESILYFSLVEFTDEKGDQFRLASAGGSVYLMNDSGKTIDKY